MLRGTCGRMDCSGDCRECYGEYEEEGDDMSKSCENGHEEIVYYGDDCPLCEAQAEIEAYKDSIESLLMALNEDYTVVLP